MKNRSLNKITKKSNVLFNIILFTGAFLCIVPVFFIAMISLSSNDSIQMYGYQFIPNEFSLSAYKFLWNEKAMILHAFWMSIVVTSIGIALGTALTTTIGYALSRRTFRLKGFLTWLIFIPMIFNGGMVAAYVVNSNILGLRNTIWAMILPIAVSSFNVIICKTFFRMTVPESIIESAKIDGATQLTIFLRVVVPISTPLFATIGIFLAFGYWNDWFLASLYISDRDLVTLQALLNNILKNIQYLANNPSMGATLQQYRAMMPAESARMAIALVTVLPIACVYPFFQKYFINGLTVGAVKG